MSSLDGATGLLPLLLADEEEAEAAAAADDDDDGDDDDDAAAGTGTEPPLVLSLVLPGSLSLSGSVSGSDGPPEPPSDLGENPPPPPPFLPLPLLLPPPLLPPSLLPCSRLRAVGVRGDPEPLSSSEDVAPKPNTPPPGFGQRFVGMQR